MFFILSKLVSFFFTPISWIVLLLLLSFFWKGRAKLLRWTSVGLLLFFSSPLVMNGVNHAYEHPIVADEDLEHHKIGVVLGGYAAYDTTTSRVIFRFGSDRFNQAIRLLKNGTIDRLIVSGGSGFITRPDLKEALYVGDYLEEIGIPKRKFILESESKNSRENAVNTAQILADMGATDAPVMLITSGFHMPRAQACFDKVGIHTTPYATDVMSAGSHFTFDLLLPNAMVLAYWNVLIHEWVGFVSYWFMSYV